MKIFGLTGGIGCGKSTVSRYWMSRGLPVIDADLLSREVLLPPISGALYKIKEAFGDSVVKNNRLDRKALGRIVFGDKEKLSILEGILEVPYKELFSNQVLFYSEIAELICYDNAVLLEKFNWQEYKPIVVVHVPLSLQIQRIKERDRSSTHQEIMDRIYSQMPGVRKLKYADYIIDNSGPVKETLSQADTVLKEIKSKWL